jgi:hypothetical protein
MKLYYSNRQVGRGFAKKANEATAKSLVTADL